MKKGFRVSPDCVRCSVIMLRFRNAGRLCLDAFKLKFVIIMVLSCSHSGESCGRSGGLRYMEQKLYTWMQNLQWKTVLP
jgi:hypothetical protein